jgi:hypothetical protein
MLIDSALGWLFHIERWDITLGNRRTVGLGVGGGDRLKCELSITADGVSKPTLLTLWQRCGKCSDIVKSVGSKPKSLPFTVTRSFRQSPWLQVVRIRGDDQVLQLWVRVQVCVRFARRH